MRYYQLSYAGKIEMRGDVLLSQRETLHYNRR